MFHRAAAFVITGALLLASGDARAFPSGISGRTLKSTTAGCGGGSCHGSGAAGSVTVTISGPDTMIAGQSATYTVTVTGSNGSNGGVDIAVGTGSLAVISSFLKMSGGEAVHRQRVSVPSTYQVTYTAPAGAGTDTMYATGKDNGFNNWNWAPNKPILILSATGVAEDHVVPGEIRLESNFPNPFNPSTLIRFSLPEASHARLTVLDASGRLVAVLADGGYSAGAHTASFSADGRASGIYLYRLEVTSGAAVKSITGKMLLLK